MDRDFLSAPAIVSSWWRRADGELGAVMRASTSGEQGIHRSWSRSGRAQRFDLLTSTARAQLRLADGIGISS